MKGSVKSALARIGAVEAVLRDRAIDRMLERAVAEFNANPHASGAAAKFQKAAFAPGLSVEQVVEIYKRAGRWMSHAAAKENLAYTIIRREELRQIIAQNDREIIQLEQKIARAKAAKGRRNRQRPATRAERRCLRTPSNAPIPSSVTAGIAPGSPRASHQSRRSEVVPDICRQPGQKLDGC